MKELWSTPPSQFNEPGCGVPFRALAPALKRQTAGQKPWTPVDPGLVSTAVQLRHSRSLRALPRDPRPSSHEATPLFSFAPSPAQCQHSQVGAAACPCPLASRPTRPRTLARSLVDFPSFSSTIILLEDLCSGIAPSFRLRRMKQRLPFVG